MKVNYALVVYFILYEKANNLTLFSYICQNAVNFYVVHVLLKTNKKYRHVLVLMVHEPIP